MNSRTPRDPGRTFDGYEIRQTVILNVQDTFHHSCQKTCLWLQILSLNGSVWRGHILVTASRRITNISLLTDMASSHQ